MRPFCLAFPLALIMNASVFLRTDQEVASTAADLKTINLGMVADGVRGLIVGLMVGNCWPKSSLR